MLNSRMIDLYAFASDQDTGLGDPFLIRRRRVKVVTLYTVRTDVSKYPLPPARAAGDLPKEWDFPWITCTFTLLQLSAQILDLLKNCLGFLYMLLVKFDFRFTKKI